MFCSSRDQLVFLYGTLLARRDAVHKDIPLFLENNSCKCLIYHHLKEGLVSNQLLAWAFILIRLSRSPTLSHSPRQPCRLLIISHIPPTYGRAMADGLQTFFYLVSTSKEGRCIVDNICLFTLSNQLCSPLCNILFPLPSVFQLPTQLS